MQNAIKGLRKCQVGFSWEIKMCGRVDSLCKKLLTEDFMQHCFSQLLECLCKFFELSVNIK